MAAQSQLAAILGSLFLKPNDPNAIQPPTAPTDQQQLVERMVRQASPDKTQAAAKSLKDAFGK